MFFSFSLICTAWVEIPDEEIVFKIIKNIFFLRKKSLLKFLTSRSLYQLEFDKIKKPRKLERKLSTEQRKDLSQVSHDVERRTDIIL